MQIKSVKKRYGLEKTIPLMVNDLHIRAEPDTGADVNVMDEHQYRALLHRSKYNMNLQRSQTKLRTLQNDLPIKGEFDAVLRNQTCGKRTKFLVIKGKINSPPLISKNTLIELGMLQIKEDGSFADKNDMRMPEDINDIHAVLQTVSNQAVKGITNKFKSVFEGIGRIRDIKNDKELYVQFNMKANAAPVAQRPRPVPYYLQQPLKLWLDQCVEEGLFEIVPSDEPITWCSPVVVQPKPKYLHVPNSELQPNMIRACIDLRVPNKFMERNRITQGPVVENFIYKFHDCVIFSKLDLRSGYHQLMLHPNSRAVVTFSTPWGNYRPKRLVFGAKASQDLFDDMMFRIFGDIPMCMNQRDDILIGGRNMDEHNKTLEAVFQKAKDFGITFNLEKCQFGVEELEFYGYRFTKEGLKPTLDKVKAVKDSRCPETKEAVRSFLGMTGYLSKFIPRYTSLTAPLRKLTQKAVRFHWGIEEQTAFEKL
ncbi:MAG: reverse transcriptase family protein, partial [Candidatus Thiodiazotropha endolucinida]